MSADESTLYLRGENCFLQIATVATTVECIISRIYLETDGSDGGQKPVTLVLTLLTVLTVLWTAEISCTAEPDTPRPAGRTTRVFTLCTTHKFLGRTDWHELRKYILQPKETRRHWERG